MTWIVGRSMPFGYAAGISDVRVTLEDGTEHDCLQKIYPVGRFIAMGFAGSVIIGFEMVDRLTDLLRSDDPKKAWDASAIAEWWPGDAREVFSGFGEDDAKKGSELILLSAHPTEDLGNPLWPRCSVHRFRAPNFMPELAGAWDVVSIGSGAGVDLYGEALDYSATNYTDLQQEVGNPGGASYGLMFTVSMTVERNPVPCISPLFQICIVRRGGIDIHHSNRRSFGASAGDLVMPRLATNAYELGEMLLGDGLNAKGARC
jgi:hypothetical protein